MLLDHSFSQRNKATKRALGVEVGGNGGEGWAKFEKGQGVGKLGGHHKIAGIKNPSVKYEYIHLIHN